MSDAHESSGELACVIIKEDSHHYVGIVDGMFMLSDMPLRVFIPLVIGLAGVALFMTPLPILIHHYSTHRLSSCLHNVHIYVRLVSGHINMSNSSKLVSCVP